LESLGDRERFDLIADFALPLPVTVIATMLGIPAEDQDRFRTWTAAILGRGGSPEDAAAAGLEFITYLNDIAAIRRQQPQDDMISTLLHGEEEGERLSHEEFLAMVLLLLIAGFETTVNLIGNGAFELMRHPDQYQRLRADRGLLAPAVEEMLRFHGPVESTTYRWAYEQVEIGGHVFQPGDLVVAILMSANRDPSRFTSPDTFDIARSPNRHIAFGSGIHRCLGAPLARIEGQIAFKLLNQHGTMQLTVEEHDLQWTEGFFVRGLERLPVSVTA
jgi:cytochrome P450 PksS